MIKKKVITVCVLFVVILIMYNIGDYVQLHMISKENMQEEHLTLDESIDLVGLMDSYGVPYSPLVENSFQDMIAADLLDSGKINSSLDLFNLYINKTWALNGVFENRISVGEFKELQNFSIDFVRHKYGERVRNNLFYDVDPLTAEKSIYDYVSDLKSPVILYSCSANDLFYYYSTSLESITFAKFINLVKHWSTGLELLEVNVEQNLDTLFKCNPRAQIYVMGLYVPTDNFFLQRLGTPFIKSINERIARAASHYKNAVYVDVTCVSFGVLDGDFHPDADGQKMIAHCLKKAIEANIDYSFDKEEIDNSGVTGNNENRKMDRIDINAKDLYDEIIELQLPIEDYVECAVAIEKALQSLQVDEIDYEQLSEMEQDFVIMWDDTYTGDLMKQGYDIILVERKLLSGIIESENSLYPETAQNDKLGLLSYY